LIILFVKGARERWGANIAFAAFSLVLCYWTLLAVAHSRALTRGSEQAAVLASLNGETVTRLAAMPTVVNPFRWDCVFETDQASYRFSLGLVGSDSVSRAVRYEKPQPELQAKVSQQRPARVFLGFARFPVMQLEDPSCTAQTLVQLADLRYTEPGSSRGTFSLELPIDCPLQ
jgi:hypothetical protein